MVPILSRRSIVILVLGLVVGVLLAFAYWIISPAFIITEDENGTDSVDTGILGLLGIDPGGPYYSKVSIQLVNPGTEYQPLYVLQESAEYFSVKYGSLPFFEFLSEELDKQPIEYSYTVDELDAIITTSYDYNAEIPAVRLTVTTPTEEEAAYLIRMVPQLFVKYLEEEEKDKREQLYATTLEDIENIKDAYYEAQLELDALTSEEIFNNPTYIALSARVDALQKELDVRQSEIAIQYLERPELQEEYDKTLAEMEQVNKELAEAELELQSMSGQELSIEDATLSNILEAKIRGLQTELDSLISGTLETTGLTEMISTGITSGIAYENLMLKIETTAEALAEAQREYDDLTSPQVSTTSLGYKIAQMKVDTLTTEFQALQDKLIPLYNQIINLDEGTGPSDSQLAFDRLSIALAEAKKELETFEEQVGYDSISADTNLAAAQDKVENFNYRLEALNKELADLIGIDVESIDTEYLVAGNPTIPSPVLPERSRARNTLLTGAIAGIIIAWVVMNFRWLVNLVSPSGGPAKPDEDEE
jgi:hypothetical protein